MHKKRYVILAALVTLIQENDCQNGGVKRKINEQTTQSHKSLGFRYERRYCMPMDRALRARRKSCFLRPDTGPCRADIIQWYFDVTQRRCYRFFWGGCQGNGNRFQTQAECFNACFLNASNYISPIPHFCSQSFDYGKCFGHYNRWTWDTFTKSCRQRIYSGCGGNQNNFETREECVATCVTPPNNTVQRIHQFTTCIPFHISDLY
ncbi:hypothetical protein ACJJTC_018772 [Scirpophaga incertulas]